MKKLLSTLLSTLFIIGLSTGCATVDKKYYNDYTYEGDYNPAVFMEWEIVGTEYFSLGEYPCTQVVLSNPDFNSTVSFIVAVVVMDDEDGWSLISYGYNKHGVDYFYILNIENSHYELWMARPSTDNIHNY